jgi:hypothetical protein
MEARTCSAGRKTGAGQSRLRTAAIARAVALARALKVEVSREDLLCGHVLHQLRDAAGNGRPRIRETPKQLSHIEPEAPMTEQRNVLTPDTDEGAEKSSANSGVASGAPLDSFANLEDKGGWLTFRVTRAARSIPVRITREAMEDHFGAGPGEKGLAEAYLQYSVTINAKVLELAPSGDVYSTENPLKLSTGDFD